MKKNNVLYPLLGLRVHLNRCLPMKLMILLVLVFSIPAFSAAYSQEGSVSFSAENMRVEEIIKHVRSISGYKFLFNHEELRTAGTKSVKFANTPIREVMNEVLRGTNLTYRLEKDVIVIYPIVVTARDSVQKSVTVKGVVKDEKGATLPGVTVLLKGTTIGVTTDEDGKFSLTIPESPNAEFLFSFVGMIPQTVLYRNMPKGDWTVVMKEEVMEVDEVVVTGLLMRKKSGFAGTTTMITKQELAKVSTGNIFTTISAIDAGFKINENNLDGSNPNVLPDFTIRGKGSFQNGSTAPIFILDGFEVSAQKVFDMDVNRIESITLLKDASATILYGSRASNGVIVIETTAPQAGKLRVTYDFKPTIGVVDLTDYDLMNAREKLQYEKEAGLYEYEGSVGYEENNRREQAKLDEQYYTKYKNIVEGVNTYWLSQPVESSFSHAHSIFVEGGADNVRYGIDASYNQNKGVMKESGRDRLGLGFTLIYRIKDKVTIRNYMSYAHTKAYNSPYGSFSTYAALNPYERIYDENGELIAKLSDGTTNPLYDAFLPNRSFTKMQEFTEQLSVDWFIREGLRLKGQISIVKGETSGENYKSPFSAEFLNTVYNSENRMQEYLPIAKRGYLSMTDGSSLGYNGNITLNYNTLFGEKHILYAGIGCEVKQDDSNSHGFTLTGFPDDRYSDPAFAIQFKENSRATSDESKSRSIGFFANGNYIYDDRYFADVSVRIDGSSKFGVDKCFAPFWSVGAGWNVHNEKFFKSTKVSMLKLRYSYGVTGNQEFSAYQAQTMFQFNTDRLYNSSVTAELMGYGNPDLEWQNQYQSNFGVDFGYAKDRIRVQFNYYLKKTQGLLTTITVAPSLGFPSDKYTANLGEIQNKGLEVNLNAVIIRDMEKELEWSVMFQAANNKNKIRKISTALKTVNDENNKNTQVPGAVYEEGESMSAIKAVRSLGIDPTTGKELFVKKNGELTYTWDAEDKVICGDTEPKVFGNFGTNLYWKGWNLNMVFKYNFGADYYNSTLAQRVEGADPAKNADRRVLKDRWKEPGQHALYKNIKDYKTTYISSRFVQKDNTVQLSTLSLSYEVNKAWISRFGMNTLRLSFYMNDVFRASTVKNERGIDYPFQRSFVFGLNVSF